MYALRGAAQVRAARVAARTLTSPRRRRSHSGPHLRLECIVPESRGSSSPSVSPPAKPQPGRRRCIWPRSACSEGGSGSCST
eukprot:6711683-Prymnesium_polylepis.1